MQVSSKSRYFLGFLVGASSIGLASSALAQAAEDTPGLEEIIVTAQKREQNLQEVPLAVSAISAAKVEQLGIRDSRDLSGLAPNVTITPGTTSNSAAVISIRGIPTPAAETFGLDTANALYVDGIFIARSGASALDVTEIERVEVLRGPQGTLFGRNTTGGAIAFISRAPSKELRIRAQAGYGNYNAWNGKFSIDPGSIGPIATSFSYAHSQRNGVVDNILQPDKGRDPGSRKSDNFRVAAKADFADSGSIQYIFDWSKVQGTPMNFQLTHTANGTAIPNVTINGQAVVATQQAPVAQYLAAATFLQPGCAALAAPTRVWRNQVCNDILGEAVDKSWGHNLQIQNDFGGVKVKFVGGHREWRSTSNSDLDGIGAFRGPAFSNATLLNGLPAGLLGFIPTLNPPLAPAGTAAFVASQPVPSIQQNLFDSNNVRRHKQTSAELEFSGDAESLDWVVGGFWFKEKGSENNPQNSGFVLDTNGIFLGNFGGLGPSFVAANPARYRLVQTRSNLSYSAEGESTAIYAQATFHPGGRDGRLKLTAGGRYTWDKKSMIRTQNGAALLAVPETGKADFSKFTWNLMLGYEAADGVNLYARAATGYRSGGYNAGDPVLAGTTTLPSFRSENVTSFEVGVKTELLDRRLRFNLAGYHNVYKDLAVSLPQASNTGTFVTRVQNAGKVHYTGIEAEMQAVLSDNFSLDGNLGYVKVAYKEFFAGQPVTGTAAVNLASIVTPGYTSPFTANLALNGQFPLGWQDARLTARVGYTYEDGKFSFNNVISSPLSNVLKGDNRNLVDVQIGIERIALGSAEAELRFWGKNITNSHDFVRAIDFGALGYGGGYYGDPATYGVTFGIKF